MSIFNGLVLVAIAAGGLLAQGRGRGGDGSPPPQAAAAKVRVTYTTHDRDADSRVIIAWFGAHPTERPGARGRGLARGHGIAPGYEKKLIRAAIIPVEYRTYIVAAPIALVRALPPVRRGWEFVVIENRVLLIDRPTWTIIDVVVVL